MSLFYIKKEILPGIDVGVALQLLIVKLLNTNTIDFPNVNSSYSGLLYLPMEKIIKNVRWIEWKYELGNYILDMLFAKYKKRGVIMQNIPMKNQDK